MNNIIFEGYSFDDLLLVPQHGVLESRKDADISSEVFEGLRIDVPIISANMPAVTESSMANAMIECGAFSILHRFNSIEDQVKEFNKVGVNRVGISIGIKDGIERTFELASVGAFVFCLDVAHGDSEKVIEFVENWKAYFKNQFFLIAGNIVTSKAAYNLIEAGADAVKVGIGPGAACTTREVTGFGFPQLSAIDEVAQVKKYFPDSRVIADGGIRNSGDIVKALAAGADTVMVGRLLAGCDEAPNPGSYFGSASKRVNGHNAPEGIEGSVEKVGPVKDAVKKLAWGIRSGISYAGAANIQELRENAEWVKVSHQTMIESGTRL